MAKSKKSTAKKKILYYYICPGCGEETLSFDQITADGASRSYPNQLTRERRAKQAEKMKAEARKAASDAVLQKEQDYLNRINIQRNLFGLTMHAACAKCQKNPVWTRFTPTSLSRGGIMTSIMLFVFAMLKSSTYDRKICSLIFAAGAVPAVVCLLAEGLKAFAAQHKLDRLGESYYPVMMTADVAEHFVHARKMGQNYQIPGVSKHKNPLVTAGNVMAVTLAHIFLVLGLMLPFSGIAYGFDTASVLAAGLTPGHLLVISGLLLLIVGILLEFRHLKHQKSGGI